jgi:hypothetical protein
LILYGGRLSSQGCTSQTHQLMYPTWFKMAMDYLPIQASAVPCERVFSSSSETMTKRRNRISAPLLEALQLLKFGFKKERLDFSKGLLMEDDWVALFQDDVPDVLSNILKPESDPAAIKVILKALGITDEEDKTEDEENKNDNEDPSGL